MRKKVSLSLPSLQLILKSFTAALRASRKSRPPVQLLPVHSSASTEWILGNRHIFLSEGARQQLELMRSYRRNAAALLIQSVWRGVCCRRRWPALKRNLYAIRLLKTRSDGSHALHPVQNAGCRPRPQPIAGTPPPDTCDHKVVEKTCSLFGLDLVCLTLLLCMQRQLTETLLRKTHRLCHPVGHTQWQATPNWATLRLAS